MQCLTLDTNLEVRASTQYKNFAFNSMVNFNGRKLAASDEGLFSLGGDNDDGSPINAHFELIATDFGIPQPKRLRFLSFGFDSEGDLEVAVKADLEEERAYDLPAGKTGQQRTRVPIGRDGQGRYWSLIVRNKNGCNFAMDSIYVMPVVRSHGIG